MDTMKDIAEYEKRIKPGVYRHFKGKLYRVIAIARYSEDTRAMVVYKALYGDGGVWVRDADMWEESVTVDGRACRRFEYVSD